jgi:hypothetical protein
MAVTCHLEQIFKDFFAKISPSVRVLVGKFPLQR